MVNFILSGFPLKSLKDDIDPAIMMYSRPQKVKGGLICQMGFHCGFDSLDIGYSIPPWEQSHPKGMLLSVLGEPPPSMCFCRAVPLPEDSTRGQSVEETLSFY